MGNLFSSTKPMFGRKIVEHLDGGVNKFVRWCVEAVERTGEGIKTDAIYRANGGHSDVQRYLTLAEKQMKEVLNQERNVHVLTGALKLFFRTLESPLLDIDKFLSAVRRRQNGTDSKDDLVKIMEEYKKTPGNSWETLDFLFEHLWRVMHEEDNKMSLASLGVIFGPTLMRVQPTSAAQDPADLQTQMENTHLVVELLLQNYQAVFKGERKEPTKHATGDPSSEADTATSSSPSSEAVRKELSESGANKDATKTPPSPIPSFIPLPAVRTSLQKPGIGQSNAGNIIVGKTGADLEDSGSEVTTTNSEELRTVSATSSDANVQERDVGHVVAAERVWASSSSSLDVSAPPTSLVADESTDSADDPDNPCNVARVSRSSVGSTGNGSSDSTPTRFEGSRASEAEEECSSTSLKTETSHSQHNPDALGQYIGQAARDEECEAERTVESPHSENINILSADSDRPLAPELDSNQSDNEDELHGSSVFASTDTKPADDEITPATEFLDSQCNVVSEEVENYAKGPVESTEMPSASEDVDTIAAHTDQVKTPGLDSDHCSDKDDIHRSTSADRSTGLAAKEPSSPGGTEEGSQTGSTNFQRNSLTPKEARQYFRMQDGNAETNVRPAQNAERLLSMPNICLVEKPPRQSVEKVVVAPSPEAPKPVEDSAPAVLRSESVKDRIKQFS